MFPLNSELNTLNLPLYDAIIAFSTILKLHPSLMPAMYNGEPVHLFVFPFKARNRSLVSWQQTHKKPFVSFCSLTRIMDPLLCTSRNYILIHPSTFITVQYYKKPFRKGRSHQDFFSHYLK